VPCSIRSARWTPRPPSSFSRKLSVGRARV
jgi:hypothetical protein